MARHIVELAETTSTNDWIAGRSEDGLWVRADVQSAGRGRRGRRWVSEPGNLFASTFVKPAPGEGPQQQLSFVAALALFDAASAWLAPARLSLKWPNDLLLDRLKLAGILLESAADGVVIGLGMNLTHHPAATERPATSMAASGVAAPAPQQVCEHLADAFSTRRARWREHGFSATRQDWLERASGIGEMVIARLGTEELSGTFLGLDEDGALQLRLPEGTIRPIHAGEVFLLEGQR